MPPEQPSLLAVVDLALGPAGVSGRVEYVEPSSIARFIRVRWAAGKPPPGYEVAAGGLVYVADRKPDPRPPDDGAVTPRGAHSFTYEEGFDQAEWMLVVMLAPPGHEIRAEPAPDGVRTHEDRVAAYWRLTRPPQDRAPVARIDGRLEQIASLAQALEHAEPQAVGLFHPDDTRLKYDVFLSYRRADDQLAADRIRHVLVEKLGSDRVFQDIREIEEGDDFPERIDESIGRCRVFLPLIGRLWLDPGKPPGERRVDRPIDWPRQEIERALQLHRLVIPLLLDGVDLHRDAAHLPESIRPLANLNGFALSQPRIDADAARLAETLAKRLAGLPRRDR